MFPDALKESERAKDGPVKKGTTVYIAGFDTFVLDKDSNVHEILWGFFKKEFPESTAQRVDVLKRFSDIPVEHVPPEMRSLGEMIQFGHVLYY